MEAIMKKFIFLMLTLFLISSCGDSQRESVHIPEDMMVLFEMPEMPTTELYAYTTECIDLPMEKMLNTLFREEPEKDNNVNIAGQRFYTEERSLLIYDGGESSGLGYGGNDGGFCFFLTQSYPALKYGVFSEIVGPRSRVFTGYNENDLYSQEEDLTFGARTEIIYQVEEMLNAFGFQGLDVSYCYSLRADVMQQQADAYIKELKGALEQYTFTAKDEMYLIFFRQEIDNIPIVDHDVQIECDAVSGYVTYGENGVIEAVFNGFNQPIAREKIESIVSPQDCFNEYLQEYTALLERTPVELTCFQLWYVSSGLRGSIQSYIPAWILEIKSTGENEFGMEYVTYQHVVWNAETGERIKAK